MTLMAPTLRILGTRGIPAAHGGFETFAERLALYLVAEGWRVIVYCQAPGHGPIMEDHWQGIERVTIPSGGDGSWSTVVFDWHATRHAARHRDLCLTLGYNTAIFCAWLRAWGVTNVINMDGIEWQRAKWGKLAKAWFWLNERAGCMLGDHLVADHPAIAEHLQQRVSSKKISVIAYGADLVTNEPRERLEALDLVPGQYWTVIARAEPENSVLEIVEAFSRRPRGCRLVVLGNYSRSIPYQRTVLDAAGPEVAFLGAIYDKAIMRAIRAHAICHVHGHQVGGTNPSLVEALGAGNAVVAHDNRFNRWVAGDGARYFSDVPQLDALFTELNCPQGEVTLQTMRHRSRIRFENGLTWDQILISYAELLAAKSKRYTPRS